MWRHRPLGGSGPAFGRRRLWRRAEGQGGADVDRRRRHAARRWFLVSVAATSACASISRDRARGRCCSHSRRPHDPIGLTSLLPHEPSTPRAGRADQRRGRDGADRCRPGVGRSAQRGTGHRRGPCDQDAGRGGRGRKTRTVCGRRGGRALLWSRSRSWAPWASASTTSQPMTWDWSGDLVLVGRLALRWSRPGDRRAGSRARHADGGVDRLVHRGPWALSFAAWGFSTAAVGAGDLSLTATIASLIQLSRPCRRLRSPSL